MKLQQSKRRPQGDNRTVWKEVWERMGPQTSKEQSLSRVKDVQ